MRTKEFCYRVMTMRLSPFHPALRGLCHFTRLVTRQRTTVSHNTSCTGPHRGMHSCLPSLSAAPITNQSIQNCRTTSAHRTLCKSTWNIHRLPMACKLSHMRTASIHQLSKLPQLEKGSVIRQECARCQSSSASDETQRHFPLSLKGILQASPTSVQPYLNLIRFDKPIGTWLLYLPCTWSIGLAATPGCLPDIGMLALFGLGSFCMRGAGCTINDMWDRDFDRHVERCKSRPLAAGQITYFQALVFLGLQLSASLAILLTLNWHTVFLGSLAMFLVVTYPLMKRVTYWPQVFLGLTLNWGVLVAWTGLHGNLQLPGAILYVSCVLWTVIYDTIYSHQDKADDLLIGLKSTALRFGDDTKSWLLGFGSVMLSGLTLTGLMCDQTWPYFLGVGGVAAHLLHQIYTVNLDSMDDCARKFRSNRNLGLFFFGAIIVGNLLKPRQEVETEPEAPNSTDDKS